MANREKRNLPPPAPPPPPHNNTTASPTEEIEDSPKGPWTRWAIYVIKEIDSMSKKLVHIQSTIQNHETELRQFDITFEKIENVKYMISEIKEQIKSGNSESKDVIQMRFDRIRDEFVDLEKGQVFENKKGIESLRNNYGTIEKNTISVVEHEKDIDTLRKRLDTVEDIRIKALEEFKIKITTVIALLSFIFSAALSIIGLLR